MSLAAEQSVIGCLLLEPDDVGRIVKELSPEMFNDAFLGRAFYEIKRSFEEHEKIDAVVVGQRLVDSLHSEKEVEHTLGNCISGRYESENVDAYIDVIRSEYIAKKAEEILNKTAIDANSVEKDIRDAIASLQALIGNNNADESSVPEIAEAYKDEYFKEDDKPRITIGLKKFDDEVRLCGGDVMAIGARPKTGKSALAMQIAIYLESIGIKVGYFNLEMTKKQIFERLIAFVGRLELNRIRNATRFMRGEEEDYNESVSILKNMKNMTIYCGTKRVSDIRTDINGKDFDVIIIDYLQLLKSDGKRGANRYAEVGDISRGIKAIAMDYDIPVIILSQLNRVSELKTDKEPTAADFRESGDIEQDVSVALLLWSPDKDDDTKRVLKIELNRQGKRCREELYFDGAHMKFYETEQPVKKQTGELQIDSEIPFE
jgi:replicative DNA helicase